jgi:hypothetical protein
MHNKTTRYSTVRRSFLAGLLAASAVIGHAQNGPPPQPDQVLSAAERKAVIDTLIQEVGSRYVSPDIAKKIETDMRARLKSGAYDGITSAKQLASTLSTQLYDASKDKHMGVRFSARSLPPSSGGKPSPEERAQELAQYKMRNFGVERVERLPGNIGYLDLRNFVASGQSGATIGAAMTLLQHTDAIIIDLRKNGGGEPSGVALVASYFLDAHTHLTDYYERGSGATEQSWSLEHLAGARYGATRPLYILTSARTFSAAEEFAYDLQALKRAVVVGETTGGGAHPGDVYRLGEHFQMFIPTGRSINPVTKGDWDKVGVSPDVSVPQERALASAQLTLLKTFGETARDPRAKAELQARVDELEAGLKQAPTVK